LNAFQQYRDRDHLLQIAKAEKNQDLRMEAIRMFKDAGGAQADVWQIYQSETSPEAKMQILEMLPGPGNLDRLVEVARNEKDPKVRYHAIQRLGNDRASATTGDALVSIYGAEQDQNVKRSIIDALSSQHNAKALVAAAKTEKDDNMKRRILERLVNIKSPEATEYLMEILRKQ
jgi:HEAT repeat protein